MSLRDELMETLADIPTDPMAWVPLRRKMVERCVDYLMRTEETERAARALVAATGSEIEQSPEAPKPQICGIKRQVFHISDTEMRAAVIAEIQRLAKDGVAPSVEEYEAHKGPNLPLYKTFWQRCKIGWQQAVKEAGLESKRKGSRKPMLAPVVQENGKTPRYST